MKILVSLTILLVSVIYGLPNLLLAFKLGNDYAPLVITKNSPIARDEAYAYAPQVKHILEGNFTVGDILVEEYKNYPTPFLGETLPAQIFALLAAVTGSIPKAFVAADFIFPPIIFLLLFLFSRILIKDQLLALAVALVATISRDLIAVLPYPHETFLYLTNAEGRNYFLHLARAFHPQLTFIFFLGAFLSLKNLIEKPKNKINILAFGVLLGSLFYSYLFYWTYFLAFVSFTLLYLLIKKEMVAVKNLATSLTIAAVIALPYLWNMFNFYQLDLAGDFTLKSSSLHIGIPITIARYLILALAFLLLVKTKGKETMNKVIVFLFLISGVLLPIISNLIIGQDLETMHYIRRAIMPVATVALFIIIYKLLGDKKKFLKAFSIIVIFAILIFGIKSQLIATNSVASYQTIDPNLQMLFLWLNKNTQANDVVGTLDTTLNYYLSLYTHHKLYFPPTDRTITPTEEGAIRYTTLANLLGIDPTWQKQNLDNVLSYMFIYQAYTKGIGLDFNSPARHHAEELIDNYSNGNWQKNLALYKLDYVVLSFQEFPVSSPNLEFTKPITSIGEYVVFKRIDI